MYTHKAPVVLGAYAAMGAGTLGVSKIVDSARRILSASPAVGPEAWRRGETDDESAERQ